MRLITNFKCSFIFTAFAFAFLLLNLASSEANAYMTIGESGELPAAGNYQLGAETQFITNDVGGTALDLYLDTLLTDSSSYRMHLGFGSIDFSLGASFKYIPFPDVDKQPAIGLRAAAWYARVKDSNNISASAGPLVSKKYGVEFGTLIPYVCVPVTATSTKDRNFLATQFVIGTELLHEKAQSVHFTGELGINLRDSYSYISLGVVFPFDGSKGMFKTR